MPRWSHDNDHLPGGRVTRALPPPAKGHGRGGAWYKRRNRTAGGRWGPRTYPANQHRVCIHTLSCVRRLTILVPIGTAFGYGTRTHTLSRTLPGREASRCAVRPQSAAQKRAPRTRLEATRALSWTSRPLQEASRPLGSGESESFKGRLDATRTVEWPDGRSTRSPHSPLPSLARRPQPGSTRRREWAPAEGESTARHYRARRHFLCGPFLPHKAIINS